MSSNETLLYVSSKDLQLVEVLKKGNREAFGALYDNYSYPLFAVINGITNNLNISEVIFQKAFLKIVKNLENYDASAQPFFTWMLFISRDLANQAVSLNIKNENREIQKKTNYVYRAQRDIVQQKNNNTESGKNTVLFDLIYLKGWSLESVANHFKLGTEEVKTFLKIELDYIRKTNNK